MNELYGGHGERCRPTHRIPTRSFERDKDITGQAANLNHPRVLSPEHRPGIKAQMVNYSWNGRVKLEYAWMWSG
jgi:hypothetical protein